MAIKVNTRHPDYLSSADKWERSRVSYEGEDAVKATGEKNLPKLSGMTNDEYDAYKIRANYPSFLSRVIDTFIGLAMSVDPVVELPSGMDTWLEEIGGRNVSIEDLIKRSLRHNFTTGRLGMLLGKMDELKHGHIALYSAESIINWGQDWVVLEEGYFAPDKDDPFKLVASTRWRVLRLIEGVYVQQIWENDGDDQKVVDTIIPQNSRGESIDFIPFCFVGVDGIDDSISKPPMIDFVNMSMSYYRNSADLEHGLHFTALPFYYVSGVRGNSKTNSSSSENKKSDITLGSSRALRLADPQAKVGVVEFSGTGLKSIELTMTRKERHMGELGSRILIDETKGVKSADTKKIEGKADTSMAHNIILAIERGLEMCLGWLAVFEGFDSLVNLDVNKQLVADSVSSEEVKTALSAVMAGKMTDETFFKIIQKASFSPKDYDPEDEAKILELNAKDEEDQIMKDLDDEIEGDDV